MRCDGDGRDRFELRQKTLDVVRRELDDGATTLATDLDVETARCCLLKVFALELHDDMFGNASVVANISRDHGRLQRAREKRK